MSAMQVIEVSTTNRYENDSNTRAIYTDEKGQVPGVNVLRLFRVFRMVRVFRTSAHLRILMTALANSLVPVLYSFILLLLVMSIMAVLATDFFGKGVPQHFGRFFMSLFSLFQGMTNRIRCRLCCTSGLTCLVITVATGDSWASVITSDVVEASAAGTVNYSPAFIRCYFVFFCLVVGLVLFNVVVAVLLGELVRSLMCALKCAINLQAGSNPCT